MKKRNNSVMKTKVDWLNIAKTRVVKYLEKWDVACRRSLEQKISDAGPGAQRANPHCITNAIQLLIDEKLVASVTRAGTHWYFLRSVSPSILARRLDYLDSLHQQFEGDFSRRAGQALEILVFHALLQTQNLLGPEFSFEGGFHGLSLSDANLYKKIDPTRLNRMDTSDRKSFDFVVRYGDLSVGIEAKNKRQWFYPNQGKSATENEITQILEKAQVEGLIPVLIARRIHPTTRKEFSPAGLITHETFRQIIPDSDIEFGKKIREANGLGFFDCIHRSTPQNTKKSDPLSRLIKFFSVSLPKTLKNLNRKAL